MMLRGEALQADGEADVAATNDVLDLEVCELRVETKLLDDARIFARGKLGVILRFGTGDDPET